MPHQQEPLASTSRSSRHRSRRRFSFSRHGSLLSSQQHPSRPGGDEPDPHSSATAAEELEEGERKYPDSLPVSPSERLVLALNTEDLEDPRRSLHPLQQQQPA